MEALRPQPCRGSISTVTKSIVPLITLAARHLDHISKVISPIPGSGYVHRRLEQTKDEDPIVAIDKLCGMERKHKLISPKNPRRPKRTTSTRTIPARVSHIPPPLNGENYSKAEVLNILGPYNNSKRSTIRSRMIQKMVDSGHIKGRRSKILYLYRFVITCILINALCELLEENKIKSF